MPGARGEGIIQAGDREVRVLFTNRALAEAEAATKRPIIGLLEGFEDNTVGITETAALLRVGMEAARRDARVGGRPISPGDAFAVMDQAGFSTVLTVVIEAVAEVLSYGSEETGEEAADPNP